MFTDKELRVTKDYIRRKKVDILNKKDGSDADYIRNIQTLIKLDNAIDEKLKPGD